MAETLERWNTHIVMSENSENEIQPNGIVKGFLVGVTGLVSLAYLLNPTAGIDLIPDMLPGVGNLDEAAAATLLISCLAYFGLDISRLFGKANQFDKNASNDADEKSVPGKVVES